MAGFDGTVKVWSVDPALEEMATVVVSTEKYFAKEAVGLGGDGSEGFSHLGKIAWHPEVRQTDGHKKTFKRGELGVGDSSRSLHAYEYLVPGIWVARHILLTLSRRL